MKSTLPCDQYGKSNCKRRFARDDDASDTQHRPYGITSLKRLLGQLSDRFEDWGHDFQNPDKILMENGLFCGHTLRL